MDLLKNIEKGLIGKDIKLVFVEGWDIRVLKAAKRLKDNVGIKPILIGNTVEIERKALNLNIDPSDFNIINPEDNAYHFDMLKKILEIRKDKLNKDEANILLKQSNYFATMMVKMGYADCMVGGVEYSTADILRPALQIIKTKIPGKKVSSAFLMYKEDHQPLIFGDCAINPCPTSEELSDSAKYCYDFSKILNFKESKIAFLSFSTKGSGKGEMVNKVKIAANNFKEQYPAIKSDGEMQFDAAIVKEVAEKKAKDSVIKGDANILVFPNLDSGNIGYKIAQRLGKYEAIGPIILGLKSPVNDLSRGASEEDVYKVAIITSMLTTQQ